MIESKQNTLSGTPSLGEGGGMLKMSYFFSKACKVRIKPDIFYLQSGERKD